jgi:hypothetical protein
MRNAVVVLLTALLFAPIAAAAAQLPAGESGVSIYVPLSSSSGIVIDGDLFDWADIPLNTTDNVLIPISDSTETSNVTWQVAADGLELYFAATVDDGTIVAGQSEDNYWNEDSLEFYVNFSGDQETTSYGPGVAQITVSPVDIGNSDPAGLTISGNNSAGFGVTGYVFATSNGWGAEIALDLSGLTVPSHLQTFGLQVQVNGSSGGDRDSKLSWSSADVEDTSFTDPSVFGTAIFYDDSIGPGDDTGGDTAVSDAIVDEPDIGVEPLDDPVVDDAQIDAGSVDGDAVADQEMKQLVENEEPLPAEPDQSRTLLIAAVLSAVAIMVGGLWFERQRKASDARHLAIDPGSDHRTEGEQS